MSSLFDQSALLQVAERLVEAAHRAGADASDAIAVRGVSQSVEVREGSVEESERSEGDNIGLRVLVGRRQAVVSTNDLIGEGIDTLAERAVAMARVAPEDQFAGLAEPELLARDFPDLDLLDPLLPSVDQLEEAARTVEIGGSFRVGRHRWHGAGNEPRVSRRLSWLKPQHWHAGDRRRWNSDGAGLRLFFRAALVRP
jgi:PmbA protein